MDHPLSVSFNTRSLLFEHVIEGSSDIYGGESAEQQMLVDYFAIRNLSVIQMKEDTTERGAYSHE